MILNPHGWLSRTLRGEWMVLLVTVDTADPKMIRQPGTIGPMRRKKADALARHLAACPGHMPGLWIVQVACGRIAPGGEGNPDAFVWDPMNPESQGKAVG